MYELLVIRSKLCAGSKTGSFERTRSWSVMLRATMLLGMIAAISVGCGKADTVPIPASDATPPTITLDAYGIPLQQGASSQDNPETINENCCALSRHLRSRQTEVSLVATGKIGRASCRERVHLEMGAVSVGIS